MEGYIRNSLIHWTGRKKSNKIAFENSGKIISSRLLWLLPCQNYRYTIPEKKAIMVCFTDIPLRFSKKHCIDFEKCGIGLNKNKMIEYGANPVFYTTEKQEERIKNIHNLIVNLIDKETDREWKEECEPYQYKSEQLYSLLEYFDFSQDYSSKNKHSYYYQRECRVVYNTLPLISDSSEKKAGNLDIYGSKDFKDGKNIIFCIYFNITDIDFIVVPKEFYKDALQIRKKNKFDIKIYENEVE